MAAVPRSLGLLQDLKDLQRRMGAVESAAGLRFSSIGAGGLTVRDGGKITLNGGGGIVVNDSADITLNGTGRVYTNSGYVFSELKAGSIRTGNDMTQQSKLTYTGGEASDAFNTAGWALGPSGGIVLSSSGAHTYIDHSTTGSAANCRLNYLSGNQGELLRVTSSRRYKQDIADAQVDPAAVLKLRGRTWRDKTQVEVDPDTTDRYVGFIAEELDDLGLDLFVDYDEDGQPDAIHYDRLTVALLAVIQDQATRLDVLAARLDQLIEAEDKDNG